MIPLEKAEKAEKIRPTAAGARQAWLHSEGPVHAPSLASRPLTPRSWIVDGLIPDRAVTLFSGNGGSGKSTIALQLAVAATAGIHWLGRQVKPCKAAIVSCEDDIAELHRRLIDITAAEQIDLADLADLNLFDRTGKDSSIMVRTEGFGAGWEESPFWIQLSNWIRDNGPGLVVLDSLYDFFNANQLDQAAARRFMGMLREVALDSGCAIMVLWHPSKSGMESGDGTSGNVAFRNAARSMLYLEKDQENHSPDAPLTLRGKKANYGPNDAEIMVTWEDGRFVPILPDQGETGVFASIAKRRADAAFLACLDAVNRQGRTVSASKGANFAPKIFAGMPEARGVKVSDLERAMERLFSAGEIEVGEIGRYENRNIKTGIRRTSQKSGEVQNDE